MDDLKLHASNKKSLESLIQTVCAFSNDIGMELGMEKCVVLTMKKGKTTSYDGIELPNKTTMKGLKEDGTCKYLGVIHEEGTIQHERYWKRN